MKRIVVIIPFTKGEEQNVIKIVKKIKKEFFDRISYEIFLVGPSIELASEKNVHFIHEKKRMGKSFWIRKIVRYVINKKSSSKNKNNYIFFVISGDVIPCNKFFTKILKHFNDQNVGMVCCRVVPIKSKGLIPCLFELVWLLYNEVSTIQPKGGEAIAFRGNILTRFHSNVVADEAYIEANTSKKSMKIIYEKKVYVKNKSPKLLGEFFSQRIRYHIGHLQVCKETGYKVASLNYTLLFKVLLRTIKKRYKDIHLLALLCIIELFARIYAKILFCMGKLPYKWRIVCSTRE
jgi:cellulose synthase/poly-beta-1,6-N-acetylglucosamine synthase-like glycosyltransferase